MRPEYQVKIGGITIDSSENEALEELNLQLSLDTPADNFTAILKQDAGLLSVNNDDSVTVQLGYDSKLNPAFSGLIDTLEIGVTGIRVLALSQTVKLLKLRLNQLYLGQTAGAIVKDLCNTCQVQTGDVQDGVTLPSFAVTHDVRAYEYVKGLAERSGYDVYFTPDGKLDFREYQPQTTHSLEYGLDVLAVESAKVTPPEAVKVYGESPSSVKGSGTSHWLTKNKIEGSAGTGQALVYSDGAVKDQSTADSIAKSRLARSRHTTHLGILSIGKPDIELGDAVQLKGFDHDLLKGDFKVRTIEHMMSKESGYLTRIFCSREA